MDRLEPLLEKWRIGASNPYKPESNKKSFVSVSVSRVRKKQIYGHETRARARLMHISIVVMFIIFCQKKHEFHY